MPANLGGIKPLRAVTSIKAARATTAKSSVVKLKVPKPKKPHVTPIDGFSQAGMAKLKKTKGPKVPTRKSTMRATHARKPRRRRLG